MDEPTAGLDPRSATWLQSFIAAQRNLGKTIVIATHDLGLARTVANRLYLFDESHRIVADGNPPEVLDNQDLLLSCNLV